MLAYLAHPVGKDPIVRADNIRRAKLWLRFLVEHTKLAILAPWLPYVEMLDEDRFRERGIIDDLEALVRCDLVIMCGDRISPGMAREGLEAERNGIPIVNLTSLGFVIDAPHHALDAAARARAVLALRAANAFNAKPRRAWLPPMTKSDLDELRTIRLVTQHDVTSDGRAVLSKIIAACEERPV
jgi:hypothetical protein